MLAEVIEYKQAERRLKFLIQRFCPKDLDDGVPSSLRNFGSLVIFRCNSASMLTMGSDEIHTLKSLSFSLTHFKSFSGHNLS